MTTSRTKYTEASGEVWKSLLTALTRTQGRRSLIFYGELDYPLNQAYRRGELRPVMSFGDYRETLFTAAQAIIDKFGEVTLVPMSQFRYGLLDLSGAPTFGSPASMHFYDEASPAHRKVAVDDVDGLRAMLDMLRVETELTAAMPHATLRSTLALGDYAERTCDYVLDIIRSRAGWDESKIYVEAAASPDGFVPALGAWTTVREEHGLRFATTLHGDLLFKLIQLAIRRGGKVVALGLHDGEDGCTVQKWAISEQSLVAVACEEPELLAQVGVTMAPVAQY
jgi:hypothetical protein